MQLSLVDKMSLANDQIVLHLLREVETQAQIEGVNNSKFYMLMLKETYKKMRWEVIISRNKFMKVIKSQIREFPQKNTEKPTKNLSIGMTR